MERIVSHLLPLRRQAWWVRYGGTTMVVALATILRMGLEGNLHDNSFYLFVPAIFVSALLFGHGPGYYAIAVSMVLSVGLFLEPFFRLVVHEDDAIPLALFVATSIGISEVTEALRRVLDHTSRAEQENALLLEELDHRTKNDLQMIASVSTLQASSAADPNVQAALRSAISRIQVVARAHERLQRREPAALVQADEYIRDLCQGLGELLRDIRPIAVTVDADKMQLPTSVAVQLGLLTNELVTARSSMFSRTGAAALSRSY